MPTVEYIYSAHSAYAYLGSKRLMEICDDHGAELIHRPICYRLWLKRKEANRSAPARRLMWTIS